MDNFGQVVNKEFLLKHWPSFKTKFEKTYGINNTVLSAIDILNFMNLYIQSNGEIENTELKYKINAQNQEHTNFKK